MATLKQYRIDANLSLSELARRANVSTATVTRAENGKPVQELKAIAIVKALSDVLRRNIAVKDISDLSVY